MPHARINGLNVYYERAGDGPPATYTDEPGHSAGAFRQLEARAKHDTWDRLGNIACPTLTAAGKYDGIALPATQEKLAARIPGAELQWFEGGHMFMIQDRAAYPAITAFLQAG